MNIENEENEAPKLSKNSKKIKKLKVTFQEPIKKGNSDEVKRVSKKKKNQKGK